LVLFAHGSRDPSWSEPFHALQRKVTEKRPGLAVELAFLEIMQPRLPEVVERLAETCTRIVIAPLFMGKGAHVRRDLAELLDACRKRHPDAEITMLPALGEAQPVLDAIGDWLAGAA